MLGILLVALARGSRTTNAYTVLTPTQTCYGVYDQQLAVDTKASKDKMIIHAVGLAPANAGVNIRQSGLTMYNASFYVSSRAVLNHRPAMTAIGNHVVDFDELK